MSDKQAFIESYSQLSADLKDLNAIMSSAPELFRAAMEAKCNLQLKADQKAGKRLSESRITLSREDGEVLFCVHLANETSTGTIWGHLLRVTGEDDISVRTKSILDKLVRLKLLVHRDWDGIGLYKLAFEAPAPSPICTSRVLR